jgi:hypothetical protein
MTTPEEAAPGALPRPMCECPKCGRQHWKLANKPLAAISGPSLLQPAVTAPSAMTTPEEAALLPCPFCGERPEEYVLTNGNRVWNHSLDKPCVARGISISEEGLSLWNRRASTAREAKLREALENIEDIATTGRISELVEKFNTMKLIAREALADKETT